MISQLTEKQEAIFEFIIDHFKKHFYCPTYRDIADDFGITVKGAYDHVQAIIKKDYLIHDGNRFIPSPKMFEIIDKRKGGHGTKKA